MPEQEERAVELVIVTRIKGQKVAVLRKEGWAGIWRVNRDKPMRLSFAGSCKLTALGLLKGNENFESALARDIADELGEEFAWAILGHLWTERRLLTNDGDFRIYGLWLPDPSPLRLIRLEAHSGGIILVSQEGDPANGIFSSDTIRELRPEDENGVQSSTDLALHQRDLVAVQKALVTTFPGEQARPEANDMLPPE